MHETIVEDLKTALASVRQRQSLEMQVEAVAQKKATNLGNRRAFYNVRIRPNAVYGTLLILVIGVQAPCSFATARQSIVHRGHGGRPGFEGQLRPHGGLRSCAASLGP